MFDNVLPKTIDLTLNPKILWILFVVAVILYLIMSAILYYHWSTFSYALNKKKKISIIYFIGSGILFSILLLAVIVFSITT